MLEKGKKQKWLTWGISILLIVGLLVGAAAVYLGDYYRADLPGIEAFTADLAVAEERLDDGTLVFGTGQERCGFIFYPGGKVEHTAYIPLLKLLASRGILCLLVEMPFRLAVLDGDAADGLPERYPSVAHWYMGGHSLGGSMAASYVAKHSEAFDGIVLLGAYSTADLSETDLGVLSIFGSEDRVMNRTKYDEYQNNLPSGFTEVEIKGGCHAYFGMYGEQDGDGMPSLSAEEQIRLTSGYIANFVLKGGQ